MTRPLTKIVNVEVNRGDRGVQCSEGKKRIDPSFDPASLPSPAKKVVNVPYFGL